jgi:hypothetical protein
MLPILEAMLAGVAVGSFNRMLARLEPHCPEHIRKERCTGTTARTPRHPAARWKYGTGSVSRAFAARGWDVVDIDPRENVSIC